MQNNLLPLQDVEKIERRGRPKFEFSDDLQCLIRTAIRGGMSREAVGRALGIDPTTIRKYFSTFFRVEEIAAVQASKRLRKMGSELHRISEELAAQASRSEGAE